MRWNRLDYIDFVTGKNTSRQMLVELFGPLIGLPEEWAQQGATPQQINLTGFCFDYLEYYTLKGLTVMNPKQEIVLEETEDYRITRDYLGRTCKLSKSSATIPLPLDYPVKDFSDWERIKPMFLASPERLQLNDLDFLKERQKQGALIRAEIYGGFDILRELMGEEVTCLAYYDQPELVVDILSTISEANVQVLEFLSQHIEIDQLSVHEDMAGKSGPLIGPNTVDEFITPYYLASWEILANRGTKIFCQDSDGNMEAVMDSFIKAGVTMFYPCEPAAGMDIVTLREKYGPSIAYKGGIDKHVLRDSKEAIRKELEYKMQPSMLQGGVVFGLDHRIPNGTPLENYVYYVETAREILGLPPLAKAEQGWGRMGF